jgi:hypothetical protein
METFAEEHKKKVREYKQRGINSQSINEVLLEDLDVSEVDEGKSWTYCEDNLITKKPTLGFLSQ